MITPEKFNKIVNKLPKDKTELSKQVEKVELSFASDLKKSLNSLKAKVKKGASLEAKIEKQAQKLEQLRQKMKSDVVVGMKLANEIFAITDPGKKLLENVEKAAKELGVSPDNIEGYKEFKEVRDQGYFDGKRLTEGEYILADFGESV